MEFLKKNKIIVGVVVVAIVALLGVWYFVLPKSGTGIQPSEEAQNVKEITPEEVGLSLEVVKNGQAVEMTLDKLDGIKTLEYELSYDAEETDPESGETATVPKGAVGSPIDVAGESSIKREILLGTCSANKCRYDKVKSDIKLVLKVTYENGEVGSVEMTLPYDSNN
jgi:hypothetical protein